VGDALGIAWCWFRLANVAMSLGRSYMGVKVQWIRIHS
jgi:hypothetical protein